MAKRKVGYKANMALPRAVSHLEDLARGFQMGRLCLRRGEEVLSMEPSRQIDVSMEASSKKGKETLALRLAWIRQEKDRNLESSPIAGEPSFMQDPARDENPLPPAPCPLPPVPDKDSREKQSRKRPERGPEKGNRKKRASLKNKRLN